MKEKRVSDDLRIERGSGNVFADLALPNPETALLKADLALHIGRAIDDNGWTDEQAAVELRVPLGMIVAIARGNLGFLSTDDLLQLLQQLNFDVDIIIGPPRSPRQPARIAVYGANAPLSDDRGLREPTEKADKRRRPGRLIAASG